ncbi:hypothetical protein SAMN05216466_106119 [Paraburkholderia phenazinium]|uniref:Uncharacterized protein n=1 Tax=Paraburkholderia phenazinium TaxID=60549 RepID=A0A1G7YBG5_9BURK|nr:hypothetical protein [Paraburkholderia phenazinium]SDG93842.1 hypothetical protein SAMN05216466_106119 [Paraburkholderia phenazinium]
MPYSTAAPSFVQPKIPNALIQTLDVMADSFRLPRNRVARVIVGTTLADASARDAIVAEIGKQRENRLNGNTSTVIVWMDHTTSMVFADLMAFTGARASEVARAIVTLGCARGLARFSNALIAESLRSQSVSDRQIEKIRVQAARRGFDLMERA